MALTKDDLQAIGTVVGTLIEKQVRPIVKEEIRAALTTQNKLIEQGFADLKAVMEHTYVNREEFEERYHELQNEVDDLRERIKRLEGSIPPQ
jgi:predicted nuclease with TOPRIM domain